MPLHLQNTPLLPATPRPICVIGAGGIVGDAHLPAYQLASFPVFGIQNRSLDKAHRLAERFAVGQVFATLPEMVEAAPPNAVYDLTLPANQFVGALEQLPDGAAVLIQKPMGETLEEAQRILETCRRKRLVAAVNFQLRFAPFVMMARDAIAQGLIGELTDLEVRVTVETPWHLWDFLAKAPAAEIIYHSIHYLDMIRSFLGNPDDVRSLALPSKLYPSMDVACSTHVLNYGSKVRVLIETNHAHRFGFKHQESYIKWEGTQGAIKAQMGLLMDYPRGTGDRFELCQLKDGQPPVWETLPVQGSWFPHAFIGSMAGLMRHLDDPAEPLPHGVADVIDTMRLADAAVRSSRGPGTRLA